MGSRHLCHRFSAGEIAQIQLDEGVELLNKPFGKADLARKLRQVLDGDGILSSVTTLAKPVGATQLRAVLE